MIPLVLKLLQKVFVGLPCLLLMAIVILCFFLLDWAGLRIINVPRWMDEACDWMCGQAGIR